MTALVFIVLGIIPTAFILGMFGGFDLGYLILFKTGAWNKVFMWTPDTLNGRKTLFFEV